MINLKTHDPFPPISLSVQTVLNGIGTGIEFCGPVVEEFLILSSLPESTGLSYVIG